MEIGEPIKEVTGKQFGLIIAFLLPGFVGLWPTRHLLPVVKTWFGVEATEGPTVGRFLYIVLASLAVGLVISAIRWAVIDTIHHCTGIQRPKPNFSKLKDQLQAVEAAVENYYRFYQYYSNMLVAITLTYGGELLASKGLPWSEFWGWTISFVIVGLILFFGSRNCLNNYYKASGAIL